ncbi:MAG: DUF2889 domain-containing protein [Actinomycetota bacterium]|jgi:hypothetical protein
MTWPTELTPDRYPGTIRREMTVESTATEDGRLAFTAVLRDRWHDDAGNEEEIHGYEVRLVVEPPDLTVVSIDVKPRFLPFPDCPAAALAAQRLVGLRLTKGFRAGATAALGGVEGCTHLLTLVLAIWNHQVVTKYMLTRTDDGTHPDGMPDFDRIADTCSGWREGGVGLNLVRSKQRLPLSVDYGS